MGWARAGFGSMESFDEVVGILRAMIPRFLIPALLLVLCCASSVAFGGGSGSGRGVHVHVHGGAAHEHTHGGHETSSSSCEDSVCSEASDGCHLHCCCGDHEHHHPEGFGEGITSRSDDLPVCDPAIGGVLAGSMTAPRGAIGLRWAPLMERPPDYLKELRTCVMLN